MIEVGSFKLRPNEIQAYRSNRVTRDEDNSYCLAVYIWMKGIEEPFIFTSVLLEAEYETVARKGIFFNSKVKELVEYSVEEVLAHPKLNKSTYEKYLTYISNLDEGTA